MRQASLPLHVDTRGRCLIAPTAVSLSIPLTRGGLARGTRQGVCLFAHRARPQRREPLLHLFGV